MQPTHTWRKAEKGGGKNGHRGAPIPGDYGIYYYYASRPAIRHSIPPVSLLLPRLFNVVCGQQVFAAKIK